MKAAAIVRRGAPRRVAFQALGVGVNTWKSWVRRGNRELEEHLDGKRALTGLKVELVRSLDRAEAEFHAETLGYVLEHGSPALKLRFLTMRFPECYRQPRCACSSPATGQPATERRSGSEVLRLGIERVLGASGREA